MKTLILGIFLFGLGVICRVIEELREKFINWRNERKFKKRWNGRYRKSGKETGKN